MCFEHFRDIMSRRKTIWCPLKPIKDDVSLRFFSVDLSRRKAVLLRGGLLWKGLGGIITFTSVPFYRSFPCLCGVSTVSPCLYEMKDS